MQPLTFRGDYPFKTLFERPSTTFLELDGEPLVTVVEEVEIEKIKAFYTSLVWRMHQTCRPMFGSVRLGGFAEAFREATERQQPHLAPQMDVIISRFDFSENAIVGPIAQRQEGVNGYQITFAGHSSWVKVDSRPMPDVFSETALSASNSELRILLRDYRTSPERDLAQRLVRKVYQIKTPPRFRRGV